MNSNSWSNMILRVGLVGLVTAFWICPVWAQSPELVLMVQDTSVAVGDSSVSISMYFQNFQDTLAGFSMRIVLDRPDIAEFKTDVIDTIVDTAWWECIVWNGSSCIDSIPLDPPLYDTTFMNGGISTTGSIISDWELVTAYSLSPSRHDIKVVGFAENDLKPPLRRGEPPREGPGLLFKMNLRIYESLPPDDSTVTLYIVENLGETNLSNPNGGMIGTITNYNICDSCYCVNWDYLGDSCLTGCLDNPSEIYDTLVIDTFFRWWVCVEWGVDFQGLDSCLNWSNYVDFDDIPGGSFDSISVDSVPWTIWNEETAFIDSDGGHLKIVDVVYVCGDANGDDIINAGDPVSLVNCVFRGGLPPDPLCVGDANGDGDTNIADAVYLIAYIWRGGPRPVDGCCP